VTQATSVGNQPVTKFSTFLLKHIACQISLASQCVKSDMKSLQVNVRNYLKSFHSPCKLLEADVHKK